MPFSTKVIDINRPIHFDEESAVFQAKDHYVYKKVNKGQREKDHVVP